MLILCASLNASADTAFFYAAKPPLAELGAYERVVVDPRLVTDAEVKTLTDLGVTVHAYVSIGEIEPTDALFERLSDAALLSANPDWNTRVVDLAHPDWHQLIFEQRLAPLRERGFGGVFLDTLDSYQLTDQREEQEAALVSLLVRIQREHPELELLLNRGFEVLPKLDKPVAGVVAESLFRTFNAGTKAFSVSTPGDQEWLLGKLTAAREYAEDVIVIDYVPQLDRQAEDAARDIVAAGFTAWVTDPSLTNMGVSELVPVPRRVLLLHNDNGKKLAARDAHVLFGSVLDWFGFVADFHDLRDGPPKLIDGVHAGVMMWESAAATAPFGWLDDWLLNALARDIPLILLGSIPSESPQLLQALGVTRVIPGSEAIAIQHSSEMLGKFEAPLRLRKHDLAALQSVSIDNNVELSIRLDNDIDVHPVITGPWGAIAAHPYILEDYGNGQRRFIIDPYAFVSKALQYTPRPVLDTTTESGSRLLTIHVDGDGFPSRAFLPGTPLSAEVLLAEFIQVYDLPHTISVIEGEVGEQGLYPEQHETLERVAREIFREPNVELASHSYSHPFFWQTSVLKSTDKQLYGQHLPIPGYTLDFNREVAGSVNYINNNLAPAGKKVKVFLWSGSADPSAEVLALVRDAGLVSVNGGNTVSLESIGSQTSVWSQARRESGEMQIYAAVMNENVFTNDWTGPYYGYNKVLDTFSLTDSPRRLKPASIYYHFYSATKPASIKALREVYDAVLDADMQPIYLSEYADRVHDYYDGALYRHLDGGWVVANLGLLRTLRMPKELGYPDLQSSNHVAGYANLNSSRYVHLSAASAHLFIQQKPAAEPYLIRSNARVLRWDARQRDVALHLQGHQPITMEVGAANSCTLSRKNHPEVTAQARQGVVKLTIKQKDTGSARLVCKSA